MSSTSSATSPSGAVHATTERLRLEPSSPALEALVVSNQPLVRLATGFRYTEGPVWDRACGRLIFSDIPSDRMHVWSPARGIELYRAPSRMANGNTLDRRGRLVTCEHATSRVVRETEEGTLAVLASHFQGRELNSPNDIVEHSDGSLYFTDPTYGRQAGYGVERPLDLSHRGVYRLDPETGSLACLADDFAEPNGLCFTPDEALLYVNDSERLHIRRFRRRGKGYGGGEVWARTEGDGPGSPDGMKVDEVGNVYCCAQGGIHVFSPEGRLLGRIRMPEETANLVFGDDDRRTLYITASTSLYRLRMAVAGAAY